MAVGDALPPVRGPRAAHRLEGRNHPFLARVRAPGLVKLPRFRTRLFLILALFAFVPAILLTAAWSYAAGATIPLLSGSGAWEQVAASGERAIAVARARPGSAESESALAAHEEALGESRLKARQVRYITERAASAMTIAGLLMVAFLTVLASRVAGHLSRQLSRPLDELVGWTGRITNAERLPLPNEGEAKGAPEFSVLRERMRTMAADLEQGRLAALEAERLSAFRESARQVAHELKNPLTPIRFAVASLRRTLLPEQRDAVEVLDTESARLEAMAKSFAQFGRLPEGPTATVDLLELARETARTTMPVGMTVRIEGGHGVLVLGQHDALQRALSNVLLNAVDATSGSGTVLVTARKMDGEAVLAVKDDGVGIPVEQLPRIFEPYVTQKTGGTGLGLAIVKQTVIAHGGRVEAVSAPGEGTEIRLRFPLANGMHP